MFQNLVSSTTFAEKFYQKDPNGTFRSLVKIIFCGISAAEYCIDIEGTNAYFLMLVKNAVPETIYIGPLDEKFNQSFKC